MYKIFPSDSLIEKYITFLLNPVQEAKIGIQCDSVTVTSLSDFKKSKNIHLKFSIPYAKHNLSWELYFNPLYPELGPDLIFDEEDYLHDENVKDLASKLPNLVKWNPMKNVSLLKSLNDLLQLYKEFQINFMDIYTEKLTVEYSLLAKKIKPENLEIISIKETKQNEIRFLIKLPIDQLKSSGSDKVEIFLLVHFSGPTYNSVVPELYLSEDLQKLFNNFDPSISLLIPPYSESKSLFEYATTVKQYIYEKVITLYQSFEKRKNFITTLLAMQSETLIEYDVMAYKYIALQIEHLDFHFILSFSLPTNFPTEKFSMMLLSVYHMTDQGKPFCKKVEGFPYMSHWEAKEMIINALAYVVEKEVPKFKELSVKHSYF